MTKNKKKKLRKKKPLLSNTWKINLTNFKKDKPVIGSWTNFIFQLEIRLDFRRLPSPVFDPPRKELFRGMSAGSFSRTAAGNRA